MKLLKPVTLLIIAIVLTMPLLVSGCDVVTGSGEAVTWEMDFREFSRIEVSHAFEVEITRADEYLVRITLDENLYEYLDINQGGDTLRIGLEPAKLYTDTTQKAVITLPDLRRLELSGASEGTVSGFSATHDMDFELSGASRLEIDNIKAGDVRLQLSGASEAEGDIKMNDGQFDLSGASDLELEGSAKDVLIKCSGASNIALPVFPVDNADIRLSGASKVIVNVSNRIDLDLSGASVVEYIGSPRLGDINISGSSLIKEK